MTTKVTFSQVCEMLKQDSKGDSAILESVDLMLGAALICSPLALGPAAAGLLTLLTTKNELTKIGKALYARLTKKNPASYTERYALLHAAYAFLAFSSFFEALDQLLPEELIKALNIKDQERLSIAVEASQKLWSERSGDLKEFYADALPVDSMGIPLPHPADDYGVQTAPLKALWSRMEDGLQSFIQGLAVWEEMQEGMPKALSSAIAKLQERAALVFEAQYLELSLKFPEFALWSNLAEHNTTRNMLEAHSDFFKAYCDLSSDFSKKIDIGLKKLHEAVIRMPETLKLGHAQEMVSSLTMHHTARMSDPIIEPSAETSDDQPALAFPKVKDGFVPQSFKYIRYESSLPRLEDSELWDGLVTHQDIGSFILSYLTSPYSTETPLLLLGHPGSGKSLLTTVLAAQLQSEHFTVVRVPLREVNADADIMDQLEESLGQVTGRTGDSWIRLSAAFENNPPVIILDGYDELLQASGQVFANYLRDAQRLQEREAEQGRPVRIIITSRVTLINKAAVPPGSTVLRLLEFDSWRRKEWTRIWNKANVEYFDKKKVSPFALPAENADGAQNILSLAEQPLLLLMLALYDSESNELKDSKSLDRTRLYDSLLRRFIIRERSKDVDFLNSDASARSKVVDKEMQRLGVAALGMYNRRKVHILSKDLNDDLSFFGLEREAGQDGGRSLSQAELLLGSFFFVHKSKAQHQSSDGSGREENAAFEFLHNTFGEFLAADFIIRRAVQQVKKLKLAKENDDLSTVVDSLLNTADGLGRDWFASLVYTPMFTRPVVMQMTREWTPHVLIEQECGESDFLSILEEILLSQIKRLISKREMPLIIRRDNAQEGYKAPFTDYPLIGHMAIYSLNLVLLRLVSSKADFAFDESMIDSHEDGSGGWDRLTHIWRAWFSIETLASLSGIMLARRQNNIITVSSKAEFRKGDASGRLKQVCELAGAIADDKTGLTAGLLSLETGISTLSDFDSLLAHLHNSDLELEERVWVEWIRLGVASGGSFQDLEYRIGMSLERAVVLGDNETIEVLCNLWSRLLENNSALFSKEGPQNIVFDLSETGLLVECALRCPSAGITLWHIGGKYGSNRWLSEFADRFCSHLIVDRGIYRLTDIEPRQCLAACKLLHTIAASGFLGKGPSRRTYAEVLQRVLGTEFLLSLVTRSPEALAEFCRALSHILPSGWFGFHHMREDLSSLFGVYQYVELARVAPEAAAEYLRMVELVGDDGEFDKEFEFKYYDKMLIQLFKPELMVGFISSRPTACFAVIKMISRLCDEKTYVRYLRSLAKAVARNPRALITVLRMSSGHPRPESLALVDLVTELCGVLTRVREVGVAVDVLLRLCPPSEVLQLSLHAPELTIRLLTKLTLNEYVFAEFALSVQTWIKRELGHAEIAVKLASTSGGSLCCLFLLSRPWGDMAFDEKIASSFRELRQSDRWSDRWAGALPVNALELLERSLGEAGFSEIIEGWRFSSSRADVPL